MAVVSSPEGSGLPCRQCGWDFQETHRFGKNHGPTAGGRSLTRTENCIDRAQGQDRIIEKAHGRRGQEPIWEFTGKKISEMARKSPVLGERVRVALIGCGTAGVQRARCIVEDLSDQATLVVACDINEDAARRAKESLGIEEHCKDYREVMDRKAVNAILIAVPPGLHRDITVAAAESGKHVFCEKPIAVELSHADEMIAACAQANVLLMIGYQFRHSKNRAVLRELLIQGTIGRPVMWREVLPLYAEATAQKWLWNYKLGGGSLFEYSHSIDFALDVHCLRVFNM